MQEKKLQSVFALCTLAVFMPAGVFCVFVHTKGVRLPGAVLRAAVDVGPVIQQVLDDAEPAAGTRLVESAVPGVVSVVHLTYSVLQTVQHHLLKRDSQHKRERGV